MCPTTSLESCLTEWDEQHKLGSAAVFLRGGSASHHGYSAAVLLDGSAPCRFVRVLKAYLRHESELNNRDLEQITRDLQEWLGHPSGRRGRSVSENDLGTWLAVAIERFPVRLFLAGRKEEWEGLTSSRDSSRGPQPHSGQDGWGDFLRRRICLVEEEWLAAPEPDEIPHRLREAWFRHLASVLRGFDRGSSFQASLALTADESRERYKVALPLPESLPALWRGGSRSSRVKPFSGTLVKGLSSLAAPYWVHVGRHDFAYDFKLWEDPIEPRSSTDSGVPEDGILIFSQPISGASAAFSWLEPPLGEGAKWHLLEGALARVALVDERVQRWYQGLVQPQESVYPWSEKLAIAFLSAAGVFGQPGAKNKIPAWVLQRSPRGTWSLTTTKSKVRRDHHPDSADLQMLWPQEERGRFEVLVIHLGLIEKMLESTSKNKTVTRLNQSVLDFKRVAPFVFVTSGRGLPENLPKSARFVAYSEIEDSLLSDYLDKVVLARSLFGG